MATNNSKIATTATKVDTNDAKKYKVTFSGSNVLPVGNVYVFANKDGATIKDLTGNPVPTIGFAKTIVDDSVPAITSVNSPSDNIIEIAFNKAMSESNTDGALAKLLYTVKDSNNQVVVAGTNFDANGRFAGANLTWSATNKAVTVVLNTALPGGEYKLTAKDMKDNVGVKLAETTLTFTVVDKTPIATNSVTQRFVDAGAALTEDKIVLSFPEAMATTGNYSVLDSSKYQITKNGGTNWYALTDATNGYKDAVLSASPDAKEVTINLKANITSGNYQVRMANVADVSGNIQTGTITATPAITAFTNVGLGLASATEVKATDAKTITFKLPKKLLTLDPAEFEVVEGATAYDTTTSSTKAISNVTFVNATSNSTVTVTMNKDLDLTKDIAIRTKGTVNNSVDSDGIKLAVSSTTPKATINVSPVIQKVSVNDASTITLQLNRNLQLAVAGDFSVQVGTGTPQTPTSFTKVSDGVYALSLGTAIDVAAEPVVKTVANPQSEDAAGNKLAANTTGWTAGNFSVISAILGKGANNALEGDETITVKFAQPVDSASIKAGWNGQASTTATVNVVDTATGGIGSGSEDRIFMTGLGEVKFNQDIFASAMTGATGTSTGLLAAAEYTLSADKTTLTVKLVGLNDADANVNEGLPARATFTPAATVKAFVESGTGDLINIARTAQTATQFASSTLSAKPSATPDAKFTIENNYGYTLLVGAIDMDPAAAGVQDTVTINGVAYKVTVTAGTATVALTGTATANADATTSVIAIKDGSGIASDTLKLSIDAVTAGGTPTFKITK